MTRVVRRAEGFIQVDDLGRGVGDSVLELAKGKDDDWGGVLDRMLQGAVGNNVAIERDVGPAGFEDTQVANGEPQGALDEEADTRANVDASAAKAGSQAVGLALQVSVGDLELEFFNRGEVGIGSGLVLEGVVDTLEGDVDLFSLSVLPEELSIVS